MTGKYRKRGMLRCTKCGWIDTNPSKWSVHRARTFATRALDHGLMLRRHDCRPYRPSAFVELDPSNP